MHRTTSCSPEIESSSAPAPPPSEHKFSRYRSVRKKHHEPPSIPTPPPPVPAMPPLPVQESHSSQLKPSISRYHRRPTTSAGPKESMMSPSSKQSPPPAVKAPATPVQRTRANTSSQARYQLRVNGSPSVSTDQLPKTMPARVQTDPQRPRTSHRQPARDARDPPEDARNEARQLMALEAKRMEKLKEKMRQEKQAREEADAAERENQRRKTEEAEKQRVEKEAEEANKVLAKKEAKSREHMLVEKEKERIREERERLKKEKEEWEAQKKAELKKLEAEAKARDYQQEARRTESSPSRSGLKALLRKRVDTNPSKPTPAIGPLTAGNGPPKSAPNFDEPAVIRPGGGGVVPGTDAPISAVNAGDRRVMVECNKSAMLLPITPTTTPLDLIRSAATVMSESINPKASVLLENFSRGGVQRPLRHYEHVRDVMNSWDDDRQNTLHLVESPTDGHDEDLMASSVPSERPEEFTFVLYHSQKPGHWSKRFVTLRTDGQMVIAKNDRGKESANICHLSDFDIYTPTREKLTKTVKPPKKQCFAIKSQQKPNMFINTSNFVQYFCTNDRDLAARFYKAVQGWRSWYLVNVMGEGQSKSKPKPETVSNGFKPLDLGFGNSGNSLPGAHTRDQSIDSHYQLGSFQPLMDLSMFEKRVSVVENPNLNPLFTSTPLYRSDSTRARHSRKLSMRNKAHHGHSTHPSSDSNGPTRLPSLTPSSAESNNNSSLSDQLTFSPTGLLGRSYSQRRAHAEAQAAKLASPFTSGPSLLNDLDPSNNPNNTNFPTRMSSTRSTRHKGPTDLPHPKPLIDLAPTYKEPIHHALKGKAHIPPPSKSGTTLIASATSPAADPESNPALTISIPPARTAPVIARNAAPGANPHNAHTAGPRIAGISNNHSALVPDEREAFTGGLLAGVGVVDAERDHGLTTGVYGNGKQGPLVEIRDESCFVKGSLLEGLEGEGERERAPVVDRERRWEVVVGVGEGVD
ncbi:hypothetical protein M501DRAFT_1000365 [Patellaria atrata CBS 101060]|uniref:PH domain-containing protein n=1 Tax=Patellaria atrata CBS 101060 TaxID=1346257 RepID=A0A9P4VV25_9PEZI|nr:hypothetical protein M501DRAFT_1000365 [Patellaria atrata CBS 101060]